MTSTGKGQNTPPKAPIPWSVASACKACADASTIPGYKIEILSPDAVADWDNVATLFEKVFAAGEPVSRALYESKTVSTSTFREFCRSVTKATAAYGTTVIARSGDGSIIGFIMAAPQEVNTFPEPAPLGLEAMYALVDVLKRRLERHQLEGPVMEYTMGGVRRDFEGGHIAADLLWVLTLDGYLKGFRTAMTVASSYGSQTGHKGNGFLTLEDLPYESFEHNGTKPLAHIVRPPSAKVMVGDIESYLRERPDPATRRSFVRSRL
ncbi:hypothetical protein BDV30DRAFT_236881 [Aspergillus minisclerotigenes]|uniref:N-acetyltransferase domain-containing protein n=1 Tax=Aspergillus minisclerotigenes TaxID=656917 RepID=A0A5N6JA63_9EURO|nr:hypothetical protein BDV30DRAFT_236881 [Aspergillus minisclerotigenes]